ncbi:hypothetical protein GCM10010446_33620 [Streptomyces enissocaesilis]|uniref:Uncharacterized protein n=1 Tax=Streptomyces enissocaesilis TaxID=332589 RepID=A0ABP6JVT9_9ACTN
MRMRSLRRLTVLAAAAALSAPLGLTPAGAAAHQPATLRTEAVTDPLPGAYISPWSHAQGEMSDETLVWMEREDITLEAISPFVMGADGRGFNMPIGSTAGDGLDSKGRVFYPGGLKLHHSRSGKTITLKDTFIRVMPKPARASRASVSRRHPSTSPRTPRTSSRRTLGPHLRASASSSARSLPTSTMSRTRRSRRRPPPSRNLPRSVTGAQIDHGR